MWFWNNTVRPMSFRYLVAKIVLSELGACSGSEIGQSASKCRWWPVFVTIVGSCPTYSVDELPLTPVTLNLDLRTLVMLVSFGASMMFAPESTKTLRVELVVPFTTEIELEFAGWVVGGSALPTSADPRREMKSIIIDRA